MSIDRKSGIGCLYQVGDNLWEGNFFPRLPGGKRKKFNVYAETKEQCEIKLAEMIARVKAEIKDELKRLIDITKQTDSYYLEKRNISQEYDPTGAYVFGVWKHYLNDQVRSTYENLHKELLYTDEQQSFDDALSAFSQISEILSQIGE